MQATVDEWDDDPLAKFMCFAEERNISSNRIYSLEEPPHSKGNGKGKAKQRQYKSKTKAKQSEDKATERSRTSETAQEWRCYCYQVLADSPKRSDSSRLFSS